MTDNERMHDCGARAIGMLDAMLSRGTCPAVHARRAQWLVDEYYAAFAGRPPVEYDSAEREAA